LFKRLILERKFANVFLKRFVQEAKRKSQPGLKFAYYYNGICVQFLSTWKKQTYKGYQNPKRKLGVTTCFPEIIELKENAMHSLYFKVFLEWWLLNYL